ncbi:MAG: TolC family protein [Bacteroidales bacterium]|jgi:outer membrane protein TolC|nr:TolC family protein [Bacteroidales bacterium]
MKRVIPILIILSLTVPGLLSAQEANWTLEDCISYALANNIELQRQGLQTETAEVDFLKAKMNMLPNLNFGSDARVGFGRSIDPVTNLITFKQNLSNSYSLSSSVEVFNGFATLNTISANKFMLQAGIEADKVARNTLIVNIMGQYYQVIYAGGLEAAAKMQLDLSEQQLFRISKMVEAGREAVARKYEIESQASADRLTYTTARSSASRALTQLKQMLQLEPGTDFSILMPDVNAILITDNNFDTDSIYNIASMVLPRLKAIEYELKASGRQVAAARGALAPSLSVGGAIYTGYYKVISDDAGEQASFSSQMKNNNSQAVYFSLNIPIFNKYSASRTIKLAKIRQTDAELRLELERNNLYKEIEDACLSYNSGREEYIAAEANLTFNRKSFDAVNKKFESGLVDVMDFATAKTTLFTAETEALRTKLQLLIQKLTIQFYSTGEYANIVTNSK